MNLILVRIGPMQIHSIVLSKPAHDTKQCYLSYKYIFTAGWLHHEDGGSMDLWNDCILPQHYTCHIPEDHEFYLRRKSLKSCILLCLFERVL